MRQMSLHKLGLAALAGATIAGCNLLLVTYEDGHDTSGGSGGSSSTASSSSGSSGTGLMGGGGTGGTPPVQGRTLWSKAFGDSMAHDAVNAVAVGAEDHVYLTGTSADLGRLGCDLADAGTGSGYLVELDANGSCSWAFPFNGVGKAVAFGSDSNLVFLAGTFNSTLLIDPNWPVTTQGVDSFVAAFDRSSHELRWIRVLGDGTTAGDQIATSLSASGNGVAVGGTFTGSLTVKDSATAGLDIAPGADGVDSFVLVFGNDGKYGMYVGVTSQSTTLPQEAADVALRGDGAFAVTGMSRGNTRFNGVQSLASNDENIFLAAYDAQKTSLFSLILGDTDLQFGRRVAFDSTGRALLGGEFKGSLALGGAGVDGGESLLSSAGFDVFLARYEAGVPHGAAMHLANGADKNVTLGGLALFEGTKKHIIAAGGFLGSIQGTGLKMESSQGGSDAWVARIEFDLSKGTWIRRFGDDKDQAVTAAAVDSLGNTIIVGHFQGAIDFGDTAASYTNSGPGNDIFIAKLAP